MICKIWAIKSGKGKTAISSLNDSLDYIKEDKKTASNETVTMDDLKAAQLGRTQAYMADEFKIGKKYISGYLCNPETAIQEFMLTARENLDRVGKTEDTGNIAYHIIQSFPDDLDISDDLVHQCGLELCEKIGLHQAVVCSHIHPVADKKTGEFKGKQKHNHILINAHTIDPEKQYGSIEKMKYNMCTETYMKLRQWNDEIAIEHGLPIIEDPMRDKSISWYEMDRINNGTSWKQQIRNDIDTIRRLSTNWEEFKSYLIQAGYEIKEGQYISYRHPERETFIRDKTLGENYSKEAIEQYWLEAKKIKEDGTGYEEESFEPFYSNHEIGDKYRIDTHDATGRERGIIELIILVAIAALKDNMPEYDPSVKAIVDKRLQSMVDTLYEAKKNNVTDIKDLEKKINNTGIELSKVRAAANRIDKSLRKMSSVEKVMEMYNGYIERDDDIPNAVNELLNKYNLSTEEQRKEFEERLAQLQQNSQALHERLDEISNSYKDLKKIEYHVKKAQERDYVITYNSYENDEEIEKQVREEEDKQKDKTTYKAI